MRYASIQMLLDYRRSTESPEEKRERIQKQRERLESANMEIAQRIADSIPTPELLNKVITL